MPRKIRQLNKSFASGGLSSLGLATPRKTKAAESCRNEEACWNSISNREGLAENQFHIGAARYLNRPDFRRLARDRQLTRQRLL
jgi:hypothetical protein